MSLCAQFLPNKLRNKYLNRAIYFRAAKYEPIWLSSRTLPAQKLIFFESLSEPERDGAKRTTPKLHRKPRVSARFPRTTHVGAILKDSPRKPGYANQYIEIIWHFKERVLRFYEYGYLDISVQKFYETLALKKFQKPKPGQTFSLETLSVLPIVLLIVLWTNCPYLFI